jgi:hypothetical protein
MHNCSRLCRCTPQLLLLLLSLLLLLLKHTNT